MERDAAGEALVILVDTVREMSRANRLHRELTELLADRVETLSQRVDGQAAALRAFYRDPAETAERILRSVDDE